MHKLEAFTGQQRAAQQLVRGLIWWFYADLNAYCAEPTPRRRSERRARFERIFPRTTGFATLDRLLLRLHANKAELLMVLDHPEIPLHTNGSQNDIRCQSLPPRRRGDRASARTGMDAGSLTGMDPASAHEFVVRGADQPVAGVLCGQCCFA